MNQAYQLAPQLDNISANGTTPSLPFISTTDRYRREIVAESWNVLTAANDPPFLFQRGQLLVDLCNDDMGGLMIRALRDVVLSGFLDRLVNYYRISKRGLAIPARPPTDVVQDMMAMTSPPVPLLLGIANSPVFASDGSISTTPGYDTATRMFLHLDAGLAIPPVAHRPDEPAMASARALIEGDLLGDFPFLDESDRAHAVALLLLPFVRAMIQGPTPLHLVDSPTPGTGKTLLVQALSMPAAGRATAVMSQGEDDDEWRKRITARLMEGPQIVLIDNVKWLDSAALAAVLTSRTWEDRILGHSRIARLPVTCAWVATGNNPALSPEIIRRLVNIRLVADSEVPLERRDFAHPDLMRWAHENRGNLIWAALTLVQGWVTAGKPRGASTLGSFENWADVIGGILAVAGIPGFLGNRDRMLNGFDDDAAEWRNLLARWSEWFGPVPVGVEHAVAVATYFKLVVDIWQHRTEKSVRMRMGKALSHYRDRVFGDFRLRVRYDAHTKTNCYWVEQVGPH